MNQRKIGVVLSYATRIITILSGLIYTPIMLRLVGQQEYGLYTLVNSVVSYMSLFSLGFGSSYVRYYAAYQVKREEQNIQKLNGLFLIVFAVIAGITLVCGTIMALNAEGIFGSGLSQSELQKSKLLMHIMVLTMALTFLGTVFNCIVSAHEEFAFQNLLSFLQSLLNPFIALPMLIAGLGSVGMVLTSLLLTIAWLVLNAAFCIRKLNAKFIFRDLNPGLLLDISRFTFFIFLNQIVDQINWSVDKFLLGRFIGTAAVAVYGIGSQLHNMYLMFSCSVSSVFVPQVNRLVAQKSSDRILTQLFTKVGRIQFEILMLLMTGFLFFGRDFISLWGGREYDRSYGVALLLMIPVTVPLIQNIGIEIQRAKNKHQVRSVVYALIAVGNVAISIPLIRQYGVLGAAAGTAISLCLGNILFMNWYYHNRLGINVIYFWREIGTIIPGLVVPVLLGMYMQSHFVLNGWGKFFAAAVCYGAVYCASIYALGMNRVEKDMVRGAIKTVMRRKET